MSGDQPTSSSLEFVALAKREGLLAAENAADLSRQSSEKGVSPAQLAVQQGLLSLAQVEIIETLLNPRTTIAGYDILGLLGYGGMGVVYRARQLSLGRIVALKTVMLGQKTNLNRLSRFEQEAQTVGKLLHPHIITAYDFGRDGGRLYFAMELVEGEDVERRIDREGPFSEALTWGVIRQAAAGLAQAAELGVVHRDIKPANLLLVTPPKGFPLPPGMPLVKIADFGLALITDDVDDRTRLTADNSTVGSPHYMAPEQLGRSDIDLRADIYALGAAAYHMLTGRPPFDGLTLPQIFAQKLHGEPEPLADLRTGLSLETMLLVSELMARDPSQRIDNYARLLDRIDQLLPAAQITPGEIPTVRRSVSTETRRGGETLTSAELLTTIFPSKPVETRRTLFEFGWRVLVACLLFGGAVYAVAQWRQKSLAMILPPGVELKPSGYAAELFDGESSGKFRTHSGNWQTAIDDEGARVLAASHGLVVRKLQREIPGRAPEKMEHYRLRFNAALRGTTAIELSFGMHIPIPDFEARSVLRVERDQVILSRQTAETRKVVPVIPPVPMSLDPNRYHELRIERQATEWRAYVDDRLIGTTPLAESESQFFRIAVISPGDDKLAYFADFIVEELIPP